MASASDVKLVRRQVNEPTTDDYTDTLIGTYIDEIGITGATIRIWEEKAARYSDLVDVTEAGASHKYSDLHKNAMAIAKHYRSIEESSDVTGGGRPVVKKIQRS
jgi:hypothetical protein